MHVEQSVYFSRLNYVYSYICRDTNLSPYRIEKYFILQMTGSFTWLAKPTPTPSKRRPTMSMCTLKAAPPRTLPAMKAAPPAIIDGLRPKVLVMYEAKKEVTRPDT
ncbi:hypothetical protein L6164_017676 [Bauhinia variegata]|uniref:Uncharacterized protein n=1 Tax=Bauhinia variegata TaxID=167791 RepID=A0ACB9NDK9_BAUVA|nr:hypothetical protein L6164_017676 [Bauhinia variegata]